MILMRNASQFIMVFFQKKQKTHTKSLFPLIVSRCSFSLLYLLSSKRIPNKTLAFFRSCSSLQRNKHRSKSHMQLDTFLNYM